MITKAEKLLKENSAEINNRKQKELVDLLRMLSAETYGEDVILNCANKFIRLYSCNFRHKYAEISTVINNIDDDDGDGKGSVDFLMHNLSAIQEKLSKEGSDSVYKSFDKMLDHINLEIGRKSNQKRFQDELKDVRVQNEQLRGELDKTVTEISVLQNDLKTAQVQLQKSQTDIIAVLSIFSAVVLAFSGGFSLIANVFSGLTDTPFFKAMFFVALCGFVLFNLICLLMYFIGKITGRNIYARCKTENCSCGEGGKPKCGGIQRIRNRLPYVFWVNVAVIVIMAIAFLCWAAQCVITFK